MQQQLYAYANDYDSHVDHISGDVDGQLIINNPLLYVFIGDMSAEALDTVHELNNKKWNNSKGVFYFHIYHQRTVNKANVLSLQLKSLSNQKQNMRPAVYSGFFDDTETLVRLNQLARELSNQIAEHGNVYSNFERLNMAVVTRVDDPCNILVPEITLLLRNLLSESFKLIQVDMYGLIKEKQTDEFATALSMSFLKEVDAFHSRTFQYKKMLRVTSDNLELPVEYGPAPLFDLVYLLSDKNINGTFPEQSFEQIYHAICSINLLKSRKVIDHIDTKYESYSNQQFRQQITSAENDQVVYASAGFSKVNKPNQAIALTIIYHLFQHIMNILQEQSKVELRRTRDLLLVSSEALEHKASELVSSKDRILPDMGALLSKNVSSSRLEDLSLKEIEVQLFDNQAQQFFDTNISVPAFQKIEKLNIVADLQQRMNSKVINDSRYGMYCAYLWTSEQDEYSIVNELQSMKQHLLKRKDEEQQELERIEHRRLDKKGNILSVLLGNTRVKQAINQIFEQVYTKKHDLLVLDIQLELVRQYEAALQEQHTRYKKYFDTLQAIEKGMKDVSRQSVKDANDYLDRNIPEYYSDIVRKISQELEQKKGQHIYFESQYLGNIVEHLNEQGMSFIERLILLCKKEIFTSNHLNLSFEDELLNRANITVSYEDKEKVLSKEELYRDLYLALEEQSTVHIHVHNYKQKYKYEEKYFFADFESEFIKYSFHVDEKSRTYKLGCVHEKDSSVIEKLNMMGGFKQADIMYVINGMKYYDAYSQNGYQFHSEEK